MDGHSASAHRQPRAALLPHSSTPSSSSSASSSSFFAQDARRKAAEGTSAAFKPKVCGTRPLHRRPVMPLSTRSNTGDTTAGAFDLSRANRMSSNSLRRVPLRAALTASALTETAHLDAFSTDNDTFGNAVSDAEAGRSTFARAPRATAKNLRIEIHALASTSALDQGACSGAAERGAFDLRAANRLAPSALAATERFKEDMDPNVNTAALEYRPADGAFDGCLAPIRQRGHQYTAGS